jgi:hypothetical protein
MQEILHYKWEFGGVRVNSSTKASRGTKGVSQSIDQTQIIRNSGIGNLFLS